MCQKFSRYKVVIKHLLVVGGRLAWVLAHGASEEGKLLAREKIVLVLDKRTGFFSEPCNVAVCPC